MNFDCGQNPKQGDPWCSLREEIKKMKKELSGRAFLQAADQHWSGQPPLTGPSHRILPINLIDTLAHVIKSLMFLTPKTFQ